MLDRDTRALAVADVIMRIVELMVDAPHKAFIRHWHGEQTTVIELYVAKDDLGKVIGKKGRNAEALRAIVFAISSKLKLRAVLEIIMDDLPQ